MSKYTQAHRPFAITTPLGKDVLLLAGFRGQEAVSQTRTQRHDDSKSRNFCKASDQSLRASVVFWVTASQKNGGFLPKAFQNFRRCEKLVR